MEGLEEYKRRAYEPSSNLALWNSLLETMIYAAYQTGYCMEERRVACGMRGMMCTQEREGFGRVLLLMREKSASGHGARTQGGKAARVGERRRGTVGGDCGKREECLRRRSGGGVGLAGKVVAQRRRRGRGVVRRARRIGAGRRAGGGSERRVRAQLKQA